MHNKFKNNPVEPAVQVGIGRVAIHIREKSSQLSINRRLYKIILGLPSKRISNDIREIVEVK